MEFSQPQYLPNRAQASGGESATEFIGDRNAVSGVANAKAESALDKRAVARAFSRAAPHYELVAQLQHTTGEQLLALLHTAAPQLINGSAADSHSVLLDLGAGTGFFARRLASLPVGGPVVELDLSAGMLQQSQRQAQELGAKAPVAVLADFEALPLAPHCCSLAFANLSLQWCVDLGKTLRGIHRVLRGGGVLAMNTLLDGSLHQLREASASLGKQQHVNSFTTESALQALVADLPFDVLEWQVTEHRQYFKTSSSLLRSVNGIGAGNHMQGRTAGLLGKARFAQFCNALEQQRNAAGELELDYRVLGLVLRAQA